MDNRMLASGADLYSRHVFEWDIPHVPILRRTIVVHLKGDSSRIHDLHMAKERFSRAAIIDICVYYKLYWRYSHENTGKMDSHLLTIAFAVSAGALLLSSCGGDDTGETPFEPESLEGRNVHFAISYVNDSNGERSSAYAYLL